VEALRRLGVLRHRQGEAHRGKDLCALSYREAVELGDLRLAGEALNALAGFEYEAGRLSAARSSYVNALALAGGVPSLLGRIEQNLGVLDSVQGNHEGAFAHYRRALEAFRQIGDIQGCAIAFHNLGFIASRRGELEEAETSLSRGAMLATEVGDRYLASLCELHRAEVCHAKELYSDALARAENALECFEQLDDLRAKSDAYKVIGKVLRDSGRLALAEERLKTARDLAAQSGWLLGQAEASRELARLKAGSGRREEALTLLQDAHGLFGQLEALLDLQDVAHRMIELAA
jgi:tetratricopeptide (TPR) repeat protein